jgi:5-enolpyruvylshikimate-3-phosphate synthase
MGVRAWGEGDDLHLDGVGSARKFEPFGFGSALDHRMVMAAAVAGVGGSGVQIATPDAVGSSYPNFFEHLELVAQ